MCGRYRLSRRTQITADNFDALLGDDDWSPPYNIAPSQPVPVIRQTANSTRKLAQLGWGLTHLG